MNKMPTPLPPVQLLFRSLERQPPDPVLALMDLHAADPRAGKIDLGVGVFRDDDGATPVMRAVKAAEAELLSHQPSKSYLGGEGDVRFIELLEPIVFGSLAPLLELRGVQTPGGTGALRLGAELIARSRPGARVWIASPTWPNHAPIIVSTGLRPLNHPFFDKASGSVAFDAMMRALKDASAGDVLLLHGCCHNPTGADFSMDQWEALAAFAARRGLIPFIDLAYQGLGDGLDRDAAGMRRVLESVPEALVAYSCNKNFGLYRERVGALWIKAENEADAGLAFDTMILLARCLWSTPPDHGAAIVRTILDNPNFYTMWLEELDAMRARLGRLRTALAGAHPRLAPLAWQKGLFAMLPLSDDQARVLRDDHGIYMAGSGRLNIAGLRDDTVTVFADIVMPFLAGAPES